MTTPEEILKEAHHVKELERDIEFGGGQHLADLVIEYFDVFVETYICPSCEEERPLVGKCPYCGNPDPVKG